MRFPRLLLMLFVCFLVTDLTAKPALAQIKVSPPKVEYKTFPVGQPPMRAKGIEKGEAGLCHTEIVCQVGLEAETPAVATGEVHATLHSVSFTISAKITVWCQEGYTQAIMDHEETHRAISEHYYARAHTVARRLADDALARKLPLTGQSNAKELDRALTQLQAQLLDDFMQQVYERSEFAQDRFDAITDHGRNGTTNADAMAQALREEAEHWKTQAAGPAADKSPEERPTSNTQR